MLGSARVVGGIVVVGWVGVAGPVNAAITASRTVSYAYGNGTVQTSYADGLPYTNTGAALGLPTPMIGVDPFSQRNSAITPFTPPFMSTDVLRLNDGGHVVLELSAPVTVGTGARLGVYSNNGFLDVSPQTYDSNYVIVAGGTGVTGPVDTFFFSSIPQAHVQVAATEGGPWLDLGTGLTQFPMPTNAFTDVDVNLEMAPQGNVPADYFKPFTGQLVDFENKTYRQIVDDVLKGSAGGTWLDLSGVPLGEVRYVRFDIPSGLTGTRMMIDAVTAVSATVPEPTGLGAVVMVLACAATRRRRR
jgi:hypothetical protein